jgi:hypothetical protein
MPRRRPAATRIDVHKGASTRYRSTLYRADGVVVELDGGSWNRIGGRPGRVPHDLAHLIVEQELGLDRGLWGVLAAGGIVQNAVLACGRRPPHALERATRIAVDAAEELRRAEVLVRGMADASRGRRLGDPTELRRAVGERWWHDRVTPEALARMDVALQATAREWDALASGASLTRAWRPLA